MHVRLTILMPTLNAAAYLDEALRSIATGSLPSLGTEVLVLDGGSTDETQEIVRAYEPLTRLSMKKDGSMYEALNRGLSEARGDIIGWLNADDWFDPDGPKKVFEVLDTHSELDFAYGDQSYYDERTGYAKHVVNADNALKELRCCVLEKADVGTLAMFWRKHSLQRLGGWNPSYRMLADYEFWLRAACVAPPLKSLHIPVKMGTFRWHDGSMTWGGHLAENVHRESLRVCKEMLARSDVPYDVRRYIEKKRKITLGDMVWLHMRKGDVFQARRVGQLLNKAGQPWWFLVAHHTASAVMRKLLPEGLFEKSRQIYQKSLNG